MDASSRQHALGGFGSNAGADADGGGSGEDNALILSLYLIDSEDDILGGAAADGSSAEPPTDGPQRGDSRSAGVEKRARLYRRLCRACSIANDIMCSASLGIHVEGTSGSANRTRKPQPGSHRPWSSGGDGPVFGVHCDTTSDDQFNSANDIDGDDMWQSQYPSYQHTESSTDDRISQLLRQKKKNNSDGSFRQPHLRAVCHYGNDVNDMWRCVSLALHISSKLSTHSPDSLSCAIECWDASDGHVLLIEAAEYLPSWVDDDVLQGGVGGPKGCRNRCWLVDGEVHLIPPSKARGESSDNSQRDASDSVDVISRRDALSVLVESTKKEGSTTAASEAVQCAIQDRIDRTDYSNAGNASGTKAESHSQSAPDEEEEDSETPHFHVAAAALPASVARFVQAHPSLVPLLVDSFCEHAPGYLKDRSSNRRNDSQDAHERTDAATQQTFGTLFPYEQIVVVPVSFTRANYAELVTGRGVVPSFPTPGEYRSVELNRFQRQLRQSAGNQYEGEDGEGMRKRRNPFGRAVDVGVRLCAGLDWIVLAKEENDIDSTKDCCSELEDSAINTLGEVERRLRIYWTRIDAEASGGSDQNDEATSLPWIEQAWQAGPNGSRGSECGECDKSLLQALEAMSKCRVFNPELSKPLWEEPCPFTRLGSTLTEMVKSGMKSALKWQRDEFTEESFPMPMSWEVNDDGWMQVNSLEELEEEMKSLSSRNAGSKGGKPRRTTRRSRRKLAQAQCEEDAENSDGPGEVKDDARSLDKMLSGFRTFVDGEGELEGAVTRNDPETQSSKEKQDEGRIDIHADLEDPEKLVSQEVNIDPRRFLNILHSMLSNQKENTPELDATSNHIPSTSKDERLSNDADVSKFFFQEDLDDDNMSDDSEQCNNYDDVNGNLSNNLQAGRVHDPWSLQNIMEAMDHELRTDVASAPSIKDLSVASVGSHGERNEADVAILTNLLSSIDAQGDGSGPVTNMLREMGICPPRLPADEADKDD